MNPELKTIITKLLNNNISLNDATNDFINLQNIDLFHAKPESRCGLKFINYFTLVERLNTKGNKNISFFEFIENFDEEVFGRTYYKKTYEKLLQEYPEENYFKRAKKIYNIYYGSIAAFRPTVAMNIFVKYNAVNVLNVFSGWGGMIAAACASNVNSITAIDSNTNLIIPYEQMKQTLCKYSSTEIKFIIDDIFNVDLSSINYDMAILSPPYFKKEIYNDMPHVFRTKKEWINKFYNPLFLFIFSHLKENGKIIVNVPKEVYEQSLIPLFGEANSFFPLIKHKRKTCNHEEFIYVYVKIKEPTVP
jgi:16S rRNA G966 N2-methylase RsmD